MDIIERVDLSDTNSHTAKDMFVSPQSIIHYDLTVPPKFNPCPNISVASERVPSAVENSFDHKKQSDEVVMSNHVDSATTTIWVPAVKHASQLAPNEYEEWIKTHKNDQNPGVTVTRKRSVLSNVSYNASTTDDDSSSNTSDDDEPTTPTATQHPEPFLLEEKQKEDKTEENATIPYCEGTNTNKQEKENSRYRHSKTQQKKQTIDTQTPTLNDARFSSSSTNSIQTQSLQSSKSIHVPEVIVSPEVDHSKKDKRSWLSGFLHDLKKSSNSNKPSKKKAGLSGLFSRSSAKRQELADITTTATNPTPTSSSAISSTATPQSPAVVKSTITTKPKMKSEPVSPKKKAVQRSSKPPMRYPVNTERAIYRLSHIKLSNSRRPLQQQVVISNMMYWYLSVQQQQQQQQQQQNYYQRQHIYFNNIYQTTYQSFEPPTPGGGYHQHQPHYHNTYSTTQQYYMDPSFMHSPQFNEQHTPFVVEKHKSNHVGQHKKKKYKPVRNYQYDPLLLENKGIQSF